MGHVSEDLSEQKAAVLLNLKAALGSAQQRGCTGEQQALHLQKRRRRKDPFHFDPIHVSRAKQQQTDRSHPHASFPLLEHAHITASETLERRRRLTGQRHRG